MSDLFEKINQINAASLKRVAFISFILGYISGFFSGFLLGSGHHDFIRTGSGSEESTLRALDISSSRNYETMSIVDAAVYSATH